MTNELEQYVDPAEDAVEVYDYKPETLIWWADMLDHPERLNGWLCRLHNTEKEAEARFIEFATEYCEPFSREDKIFRVIADQECVHGLLIEDVLRNRGVILEDGKIYPARYWKYVQPCIIDKETAAAVGFFAEDLSLQRMQVIIDCEGTPDDLRAMFIPIHKDESYHTKILAKLAGEHAITAVVDCHTEGLKELGLSIKAHRNNDVV